jgi:hypothetical protein
MIANWRGVSMERLASLLLLALHMIGGPADESKTISGRDRSAQIAGQRRWI